MKLHLAHDLTSDLNTLVDTRVLVQANSGGGKSWCLRRLLEQTHGQVQHLVLDPEGEFSSLRERFDYVLAAKQGGDTAADTRGAGLLAERLLELGVSAVIDLYELKAHDRVRFVRLFLEALIDAPKKLWHPALVVVDEAHVYAPQQGEAESAGPVIDLCTRGRKRGFCAVLATQRLSKLHKDAAAELNNKLIGRTGLDVDVKRASDELGFGKERWRELRELEAGEFFVFGPALTREVRKIRIGEIKTTHPKAGARLAFTAPPPNDKIKALLPKLSDLPAEAEQKVRTEADLRKRISELERDLRKESVHGAQQAVAPERVEVPVLSPAHLERLELAVNEFELFRQSGIRAADQAMVAAAEIRTAIASWRYGRQVTVEPGTASPLNAVVRSPHKNVESSHKAPSADLGGPERKLLTALAQHGDRSVTALALLTGYASTGGAFRNPLSRLRTAGYVSGRDPVGITDAGFKALGAFEYLPVGKDLLHYWLEHLPGPESKILKAIAKHYPRPVKVEDVAYDTDYAVAGGAFRNPLSRLRTLKLIAGRDELIAAEELF